MINNEFLLQALGGSNPMSRPAASSPILGVLGGQPAGPLFAMNNPNIISQTPGLQDALKSVNTQGQFIPAPDDMRLRGPIFDSNDELRRFRFTPQNLRSFDAEQQEGRDFGPRIR